MSREPGEARPGQADNKHVHTDWYLYMSTCLPLLYLVCRTKGLALNTRDVTTVTIIICEEVKSKKCKSDGGYSNKYKRRGEEGKKRNLNSGAVQ